MPQIKQFKQQNQYPAWLNNQLDKLTPGQHFVIPPHLTKQLNEFNLRSKLSRMNRQENLNLKLHRDTSGSWWIWHDPNQRKVTGINKEHIQAIRTLHQQLQEQLTADNMPEAIATQKKIDELIKPEFKPPRRKKAITLPLEQVLLHLNLTMEQWERMPYKVQLHARINAEVTIKRAREATGD